MDASRLYDEDFLLWTEQQAAALRQLGGSNSLDIGHLAEEIEDLGKRDLREVESLVELIFLHGLKVAAGPDDPAARHWLAEIVGFQSQLRRAFAPSMRHKLDLNELWRDALRRYGEGGAAPIGLTAAPVALDALTAREFDVAPLLKHWPVVGLDQSAGL